MGTSKLTRLELDVLTILVDGARNGGDVYREISSSPVDTSRRQVYRALDSLIDSGLVDEVPATSSPTGEHVYKPTDGGLQFAREYVAVLYHRVGFQNPSTTRRM